MTYGLLYVESL